MKEDEGDPCPICRGYGRDREGSRCQDCGGNGYGPQGGKHPLAQGPWLWRVDVLRQLWAEHREAALQWYGLGLSAEFHVAHVDYTRMKLPMTTMRFPLAEPEVVEVQPTRELVIFQRLDTGRIIGCMFSDKGDQLMDKITVEEAGYGKA